MYYSKFSRNIFLCIVRTGVVVLKADKDISQGVDNDNGHETHTENYSNSDKRMHSATGS